MSRQKIPTKDGKKLKKLPENKVHLTGNYTITPEELEEASKLAGKKYSSGDKDVLLLELAYEKYRDEVMDTIEDNNIKQEQTLYIAGLDMGSQTDKGDYLSGGGCDSAIFILTGKQAEAYNVSSKNKPVCYVDSDFNMHVPDENNIINKKAMAVHTTVDGAGRNDNLDKLLDKLRQDSKDGKVDNYAATASFKVSSQEVNGKIIGGGGHGLSVLKVTDDTVTLSNPWSPEDHIEMSIDDFKKIGAVIMTNACGPCIGQWNRQEPDNTRANSIVTSFNRNFAKRADGNPNTHAFVASPETVMALSIAGDLRFNPLKDTLTNEEGKEVKLDAPIGVALPKNGLNTENKKRQSSPDSSVEIVIGKDSKRLQLLKPFDKFNIDDFNNMPLLIKVKCK